MTKTTQEKTNNPELFNGEIPVHGVKKDVLLSAMKEVSAEDADYKNGKVWSLVYHKDEEHYATIKEAHNMFFSTNYLNPMAFKSLKQFETDIVRMTATMLHGDENVVGTITSGGTESILMAIKTYRDFARKKCPWIRRPNMIVPETAHVAFDKAAKYFDVKMIKVPVSKDYRADIEATRKHINRNTILLVGSSPSYPQGVIDPITELGELAQEKKIPLHVDGCLGGFVLPFVKDLGFPIADFDFSVPGVTSMSADVHKYGYAAKGASVILYRSMDYLRHQFLIVSGWSGGIYASPALLGTRAGSAIAAAWASLQNIGKDGFLTMTEKTMQLTKNMMDGVNAIDGLAVLGKPDMTVFSYHSTDPKMNIFAVGDQMESRGWSINRQQKPDALHAMVTVNHDQAIPQYIEDLKLSVAEVKANPNLAYEGAAAMYGMVSKVPLKGMIDRNVLQMMEDSYTPGHDSLSVAVKEEDKNIAMKAGTTFVKFIDWLHSFKKK